MSDKSNIYEKAIHSPTNPGEETLEQMKARGVRIEDGRVMPEIPDVDVAVIRPDADEHLQPDPHSESLMERVQRDGHGMEHVTTIQDMAARMTDDLIQATMNMKQDYQYAVYVINYMKKVIGTRWVNARDKLFQDQMKVKEKESKK